MRTADKVKLLMAAQSTNRVEVGPRMSRPVKRLVGCILPASVAFSRSSCAISCRDKLTQTSTEPTILSRLMIQPPARGIFILGRSSSEWRGHWKRICVRLGGLPTGVCDRACGLLWPPKRHQNYKTEKTAPGIRWPGRKSRGTSPSPNSPSAARCSICHSAISPARTGDSGV